MESQKTDQTISQLTTLFNSLFSKQSLRRNVYLFNALNHHMEMSIRTIIKERRVAQITNDSATIIKALRLCPHVQVISQNTMKVLIKGDELVVKLKGNGANKVTKKQVNLLTKQIKCDFKDERDSFLIEFQSHAAAVQFIERIKAQNKNYQYQLLEKHPYDCLEKSINNMRKEKQAQKTTTIEPAVAAQYYYAQQYYSNLAAYYPVFIRRAIDSDSEEQILKLSSQKKYIEKNKKEEQNRPRFDSADFPTCQNTDDSKEKQG